MAAAPVQLLLLFFVLASPAAADLPAASTIVVLRSTFLRRPALFPLDCPASCCSASGCPAAALLGFFLSLATTT
jgi:hypothetical protein